MSCDSPSLFFSPPLPVRSPIGRGAVARGLGDGPGIVAYYRGTAVRSLVRRRCAAAPSRLSRAETRGPFSRVENSGTAEKNHQQTKTRFDRKSPIQILWG